MDILDIIGYRKSFYKCENKLQANTEVSKNLNVPLCNKGARNAAEQSSVYSSVSVCSMNVQ